MDEETRVSAGVGVVIGAALLLAVGVCAVGSAYFEAEAYNRATGQHVSTWDALWLELRVEGQGGQ